MYFWLIHGLNAHAIVLEIIPQDHQPVKMTEHLLIVERQRKNDSGGVHRYVGWFGGVLCTKRKKLVFCWKIQNLVIRLNKVTIILPACKLFFSKS